jgi:hypothetical protein
MKVLHQYIHIHLKLITIKKHLSNTSKACKNYLKACSHEYLSKQVMPSMFVKIIFSYSLMRSERELNSPKHSLQLVC